VGKPILMALVEAGGAIDEMALMLQREVAERVAAAPGSRYQRWSSHWRQETSSSGVNSESWV